MKEACSQLYGTDGLNRVCYPEDSYRTFCINQWKMDSTTTPSNAGRNPVTTKPGTTSVIAQKRSALRINAKSPKVMIVTGSVRSESTGLMMRVMTDHTSATSSIVTHPPPTSTPGTIETVRKTAAAVPKNLRMVCIR